MVRRLDRFLDWFLDAFITPALIVLTIVELGFAVVLLEPELGDLWRLVTATLVALGDRIEPPTGFTVN